MNPMTRQSRFPSGSPSPSATDLDHAWDKLSLDVTSAMYRSKQLTPHDEDPLRHYLIEVGCAEKPRDKLPTLREIDPLRYDFEA